MWTLPSQMLLSSKCCCCGIRSCGGCPRRSSRGSFSSHCCRCSDCLGRCCCWISFAVALAVVAVSAAALCLAAADLAAVGSALAAPCVINPPAAGASSTPRDSLSFSSNCVFFHCSLMKLAAFSGPTRSDPLEFICLGSRSFLCK